jgi:hypothetical protein
VTGDLRLPLPAIGQAVNAERVWHTEHNHQARPRLLAAPKAATRLTIGAPSASCGRYLMGYGRRVDDRVLRRPWRLHVSTRTSLGKQPPCATLAAPWHSSTTTP